MNRLNRKLIEEFWSKRSSDSQSRWTNIEMLKFEIDFISKIQNQFPAPIKILDLGSGSGELSRQITRPGDSLVAVDFIENYRRFFDETKNQTFVLGEVTTFTSDYHFDLVLLFGVSLYLDNTQANKVYRKIGEMLSEKGIAIIKHQVSREKEFVVDKYSEELATQYSARYPSIQAEKDLLLTIFGGFEVIEYPKCFNRFEDTFHLAFLVKNNMN